MVKNPFKLIMFIILISVPPFARMIDLISRANDQKNIYLPQIYMINILIDNSDR